MFSNSGVSKKTNLLGFNFVLLMVLATGLSCSPKDHTQAPLTEEEKNWIQKNNGKIFVTPAPGYPPFDFLDEQDNYKGLSADYVSLIERVTGLNLIVKHEKTWDMALDNVVHKRTDILTSTQKTPHRAKSLLFTSPYMTVPLVILTSRKNTSLSSLDKFKNKTVAVVEGYAVVEEILSKHPDLNTLPVQDDLSGIMKVSTGEADAMVADMPTVAYYVDQKGLGNLSIAGRVGHEYQLRFASRNDMPLLNSILEKGLQHINKSDREKILDKWIRLKDESFYMSKRFWSVAGGALMAFTLVLSAILLWNRTLKRTVKQKTLQLRNQLEEKEIAEKEIEKLRNYLNNIIDSMPSVLVGVNSKGEVTLWSNEAQKLTGLAPEQAEGKLLPEALPLVAWEIPKVLNTIKDQKILRNERFEGFLGNHSRYFNLTVYPLTGNHQGAVVRIDDITERIKIDEMMVQSEKMLSVGGLAAGMAHEINNPLAGMVQNMQVMKMRLKEGVPKNEESAQKHGLTMENLTSYMNDRSVTDMINAVIDSGNRAARIVQNMLNFSRKSTAKKHPNCLIQLMDDTVGIAASDYSLKKKYNFKHIEIIREYDEDTPKVSCEAGEIQQVFLNILKNAAQAMSEEDDNSKKPQIVLRIVNKTEMVRIEIEDNGPGMDQEARKRVFEPFYTTKGIGVGTGLGLSVSYFIITNNHKGVFSVESSKGEGARFIIQLPV